MFDGRHQDGVRNGSRRRSRRQASRHLLVTRLIRRTSHLHAVGRVTRRRNRKSGHDRKILNDNGLQRRNCLRKTLALAISNDGRTRCGVSRYRRRRKSYAPRYCQLFRGLRSFFFRGLRNALYLSIFRRLRMGLCGVEDYLRVNTYGN